MTGEPGQIEHYEKIRSNTVWWAGLYIGFSLVIHLIATLVSDEKVGSAGLIMAGIIAVLAYGIFTFTSRKIKALQPSS